MSFIRHSIILGVMNHLSDCTQPCVESIRKHTDLSEVEVIIVANGCTDHTEQYVQQLGAPFRLVSFAEPLGFAKAYNEGIRASRGEYITLLNNDTVLLPQERGTWLRMLEQPFRDDPAMGLTGPFMAYSQPADDKFLIFFCVMVKRQVFDQIGLLDEVFGAGGGEDTDFCIKAKRAGFGIAQVPSKDALDIIMTNDRPTGQGTFPIYHEGHATLKDVPGYNEVFKRNNDIIAHRYNSQAKYGNSWERHIFLAHDDIKNDLHRREIARYTYARNNLGGLSRFGPKKERRVLEIGCSAGYAKRFLPADIDYTGTDYDPKIIELANQEYGDANYKYLCRDSYKLDWDELGFFDTIICFEHLEHLHTGKQLAQELKNHCNTLICTTPYNEPPGMLGSWHVLHRLNEHDFPGFEYHFIQENGEIEDTPDHDHGLNLMIFKWERGHEYKLPQRVLVSISTKDRYEILPLCIHSVAMQTRKPDKIVILDDGEQKDMREHPIYKPMFKMLHQKGIEWEVIFGGRRGQHHNHQIANHMGYEFVWRIDDDEIAEPDVLEKLMSHFTPEVGAVGGAVFEPGNIQPGGTGRLSDVYSGPNLQWAPGRDVVEVEHLYSSFVYRAGLLQYDLDLSPVAHREETLFSHKLFRMGYRLIVDTSARTYHYRQETGGIRSHQNEFFYDHDEAIFARHMERWGVKLINLDVGLGDCFAFLNILPELKKKYQEIIIGTAYPEVFNGQGVRLIPVADSRRWCKDNVYQFMQAHEWKKSIVEAFEAMYGVQA